MSCTVYESEDLPAHITPAPGLAEPSPLYYGEEAESSESLIKSGEPAPGHHAHIDVDDIFAMLQDQCQLDRSRFSHTQDSSENRHLETDVEARVSRLESRSVNADLVEKLANQISVLDLDQLNLIERRCTAITSQLKKIADRPFYDDEVSSHVNNRLIDYQ